jgi:hypothetical protein
MQGELKSSLKLYDLFQCIVTSQESLLLVIEETLGKNQFLQCLKLFQFLLYSQNWFPTTIWVKAYLRGTIKNHPPQNHKNVGFILINERTNFKKQFPIFL